MKKQIKAFLLGAATTAILGGLVVSSMAISGQMTITVDPINIQVNGQVFQPKDPNGKEVPVFQYEGTTYAPLRALAEAYGLEVGYDAASNLATVVDPNKPSDNTTTTPSDNEKQTVYMSNGEVAEDCIMDELKVKINGKEISSDKPLVIHHFIYYYVDIKFVAEQLGINGVDNKLILDILEEAKENGEKEVEYLKLDDTIYVKARQVSDKLGISVSGIDPICFDIKN